MVKSLFVISDQYIAFVVKLYVGTQMNLLKKIIAVVSFTTIALPAYATTQSAPINYKLVVANTSAVNVTFISSDATYLDDVFLLGSTTKILNNKTSYSNQVFSLGSFLAVTEIVFGLFVNNTGNKFFSGLSSSNVDNQLHAILTTLNTNTVKVGFEDLFGGGDKDYNDVIFKVSNVNLSAVVTQPVPEPQTYLMILMGLFLVSYISYYRKKNVL